MIGQVKNILRSVLSLKKILSSELVFKIAKKDLKTQFAKKTGNGKVLVLSPHPDDEVIGCGGAILKHLDNDDPIKVIHFTDGSGGFPDDFKPSEAEKKQMAKVREDEANRVKEVFGINDVVFLKFKDSKLNASKSLVSYLSQQIHDYKPQVIYVPSYLDTNPDHQETARCLYMALKNIKADITVLQYEVWSPSYANLYLDIDTEMERKLKAIKIYQSQLKSRDYDKAIEGLNLYRGTIYGKSKYAEGYLKTDLKTYLVLAEVVFN
jgi:LmbE family N-acetylglucosaminyl deacetylase